MRALRSGQVRDEASEGQPHALALRFGLRDRDRFLLWELASVVEQLLQLLFRLARIGNPELPVLVTDEQQLLGVVAVPLSVAGLRPAIRALRRRLAEGADEEWISRPSAIRNGQIGIADWSQYGAKSQASTKTTSPKQSGRAREPVRRFHTTRR